LLIWFRIRRFRIRWTAEKLLAGRIAPSSSSPDLIRGSKRTPSVGAIPGSSPGTGMTRTRNPVSIWSPVLMPMGLSRPSAPCRSCADGRDEPSDDGEDTIPVTVRKRSNTAENHRCIHRATPSPRYHPACRNPDPRNPRHVPVRRGHPPDPRMRQPSPAAHAR
jgi:hypothetical protein